MTVEDRWHHRGTRTRTKDYGRGKRWRVRNPGCPTRSFAKKSDAEKHDTAVNADLLKGLQPYDATKGLILFRDYVEKHWLPNHPGTPRTIETVKSRLKNHIYPHFGAKRMIDCRPSSVNGWKAYMRNKTSVRGGKLSDATILACWIHLGGIFRGAKIDGVIPAHPYDEVERVDDPRRVEPRLFEDETVDGILSAFPDRYHAIPLVSATCGHRQGESFAVAVEDIDFLQRKITIRHQVQRINGTLTLVPPKRGSVRTVPLPAMTAEALAAHIARYGTMAVRCECCKKSNRLLFISETGKLINRSQFNERVWRPAVMAAGLDPADEDETGQHCLRHYYVSTLIDGHTNPKAIQQYLGHKNMKTTMDVYGHLFERAHGQAADTIDRAFAGRARAYPPRTGTGA
ncbi:Phage integrase family protein [Amycolatopsis pretoriensis]|uniref:Phage integrase family protein n=1 Tax=Amycolatopsis pretoriensis TaxID=218821 RepID=A0A1H5R7Y3_9PSEU|nr:site-specific integrase [Amycolatopsis pretoriensis]SEF34486.1 Phage integrase family protein [Amycolatopsis pretoriensis]